MSNNGGRDLNAILLSFKPNNILRVDGDIEIYRPCCVHNNDHDADRRRIANTIKSRVSQLLEASECKDYRFYLTPKTNFRNWIVDDYKYSRDKQDRPVNLAWAKKWAMQHLQAEYRKYLEADDMLGINFAEGDVLVSRDKDLRQLKGLHMDADTFESETITELGSIKQFLVWNGDKTKSKKKHKFSGNVGLYWQMLTGDNTDYIVGCGERVMKKWGKEMRLERVGVGAVTAYEEIIRVMMTGPADPDKALRKMVAGHYHKLHGKGWMKAMETQANLLFMVRELDGSWAKQWTYDDRDQYLNIDTGEVK